MNAKIPLSTEELRVLVVEDEKRLRALLTSEIPEMGFPASGAATAGDAIKMMENDPHEIVVLDLNLPGINGLELLEMLHDRWPDTRVIILTGFGDLDTARRAIHLDVVDFLTKPASLGDLETALDRARRRLLQSSRSDLPSISPLESTLHEGREELPHRLQDWEREHILTTLARNNGNRNATAAELGISRRTLFYRLAEYHRQGFEV